MFEKNIPNLGSIDPALIHTERGRDGNLLNPRGAVVDTTDLQDSISEIGRILKPLLLRQDRDGKLWLIDGQRRLTAARALGLSEVPYLIVDANQNEVLDLMLVSNVHEGFPPIVLDGKDRVTGGVAKAVASVLADGTRTMQSLARIMGVRPDVVSAYLRLVDAPAPVRRAVAEGRLSVTAFARMKHAPVEVQLDVIESVAEGDPITVDQVRDMLKAIKFDPADLEFPVDIVGMCNDLAGTIRDAPIEKIGVREEYAIYSLRDALTAKLNELREVLS